MPGTTWMITDRDPRQIDRAFVEDLWNSGGPERHDFDRLAQLVTAYRAHANVTEGGSVWLVSARPLVVAHSPAKLEQDAKDQAAYDSRLLAPLITEMRMDLPIVCLVVLDEKAWTIADGHDLDDDYKIADVPRRVIELPSPMPLPEVMQRRPWLTAASLTTAPASCAGKRMCRSSISSNKSDRRRVLSCRIGCESGWSESDQTRVRRGIVRGDLQSPACAIHGCRNWPMCS